MATTACASDIASLGSRIGRAIEQHIDATFRAATGGDCVECTPAYVRIVTGEAHPFGNLALVHEPTNLAATKEAIAPLCACGAPAAAVFPGAISPDIDAHLRASGFQAHDPMPAMAVEIDRLPACTLPEGFAFARIGPGEEADEWTEALAVGYELPLRVAEVFSPNAVAATMAADAPLQYFAVRKGGKQVATSMLYLHDGLAGVYCVATVPHERRKGLGAYLTAEALRAAHRLGYRVGVLQSSAAGHPVYQRLGFADFGALPLYVRMPE